MGIQIEFNPDLALRAFGTSDRKKEECLPERLEVGEVYSFLKEGQRNYWLQGEIPLVETKGNQQLSRPLAAIIVANVTHFRDGAIWTRGKYLVTEVFDPKKKKIHFEGMDLVEKMLDKDGLPTKAGRYLVNSADWGSEEFSEIEVYRHPVKGLCCFKDDFGSAGTGVDDRYDDHVSVQNTGIKFVRRLGNLQK